MLHTDLHTAKFNKTIVLFVLLFSVLLFRFQGCGEWYVFQKQSNLHEAKFWADEHSASPFVETSFVNFQFIAGFVEIILQEQFFEEISPLNTENEFTPFTYLKNILRFYISVNAP